MSPRWFLVGEVHSCFRRWSVRRSWGSSWLGTFCPSKVYEYCAFATAEKLRQVTSNIINVSYSEKEKDFYIFIIFLFWPGLSFMIDSWVEAEAVEKGQQALEAFRGSGNKDAAADAVRLVDSSVSSAAKLVRFYWDICVSQNSQRSWRASWVENSILEHKTWQKRSLPSFERPGSATIRRSIRLITNILQSYTILYCHYVRSMKNRSDREHDSSVHLNFTLINSLKFFSSL